LGEPSGPAGDNAFVHPREGAFPRLVNRLANSRFLRRARRAVLSRLPFLTLRSDVRDVVYLTWVVPVDRVRRLVPAGVELVKRDERTLFTVLSYRHGPFGPALPRFLRGLLPSPLQSNWRLYVRRLPGDASAERMFLFVRNVFDSLPYALGSRLGSDALPSHLAGRFVHRRTDTGYETRIESGRGSAPALASTTIRTGARELPAALMPFFPGWADAVAFLCEQDAAVVAVDDESRIAQAGISLPIDLRTVEPLASTATVEGDFLASIGATGEPFCFAVPGVKFKVLWERLLPEAQAEATDN
jgi:hypothetical protein